MRTGGNRCRYPLDLLNASIIAMRRTLASIAATGKPPAADSLAFADLQAVVGFPESRRSRRNVPCAFGVCAVLRGVFTGVLGAFSLFCKWPAGKTRRA